MTLKQDARHRATIDAIDATPEPAQRAAAAPRPQHRAGWSSATLTGLLALVVLLALAVVVLGVVMR